MKTGTECGILLSDEFQDIQPGDIIITYKKTYKKRMLLSEDDKAEFWAKVTENAKKRKRRNHAAELD